MSLLFRIIYAAHATGTHHKLALDALNKLRGANAEQWRRLFLKHAGVFLEGSKDPDKRFKDFKNHVLHVRDNYWGGAPEKVENWYRHLVDALKAHRWDEAVYSAGVLSHYYTDPIHPFHTGQTEAENDIHRAAEWSISRSYDALKTMGERAHASLDVAVPEGERWLREMVIGGAENANRYYEKLIAHYDITRGVVDPPSGLDPIGQGLVAELIVYASTGFARILDKAIEEAGQEPPQVSLTADTVIAALQIPIRRLQKRLQNAEDRAIVQRMYDELKTTGKVDKTLPEDDRVVRDLHAREVLAHRTKAGDQSRKVRIAYVAEPARRVRPVKSEDLIAPPASADGIAIEDMEPVEISNDNAIEALEAAVEAARNGATELDQTDPSETVPDISDETTAAVENIEPSGKRSGALKTYLSLSDDVEKAPSIGPKTAERLANVGVLTVNDLLEEDGEQLATMLGRRHMTATVIKDWQDQARLVLDIPGLRGTHAQLLVGSGYRSAKAIAEADATTLCAAVAKFASTSDGKSVLRNGDPPDLAKIKGWVDSAADALAA